MDRIGVQARRLSDLAEITTVAEMKSNALAAMELTTACLVIEKSWFWNTAVGPSLYDGYVID